MDNEKIGERARSDERKVPSGPVEKINSIVDENALRA